MRDCFRRDIQRGNTVQKAVISLGIAGALTAATATGAWAGWGCGSNAFPGGQYYSFGLPNEAEASAVMLRICRRTQSNNPDLCHVIDCRPNIDTREQALAVWPVTSSSQVRCDGKKC